MNELLSPRGRRPVAGRPHLDGHPLCSCGQELDLCTHAHCPRCGHRLPAPLAA